MIKLYDEKGEIVRIDRDNLIASGSKADIYRIDNGKCIKQFRSSKRKVAVEVLKKICVEVFLFSRLFHFILTRIFPEVEEVAKFG